MSGAYRGSPPASTAHRCPGGCGLNVPRQHYACSECWRRLPALYRDEINATYRGPRRSIAGHWAAMAAAQLWYRDNPLTGGVE